MSQTPITVTYSLEEILKEINSKLDKMDEKVDARFDKIETKLDKIEERLTKLAVGQAEIKTEIKGMNKRLDS